MAEHSRIDREKVKESFDTFAKRHGNENAVLDVGTTEIVKHKNVYRDFITKKIAYDNLKPDRNDVLVDFGCGVGRLSRYLSKYVSRIEAFDQSPEMIRVAKETTPPSFPNIHYSVLEGDSLPLGTSSVTKFFTFWVLQHIDDVETLAVLKEAQRVLKPDGAVFLFEQVRKQSAFFGGIQHMRTTKEYIDIAQRAGLTFESQRRVFRFPSYGMNIWQKFPKMPKAVLPLLTLVEKMTLNRKPDTIVYSTDMIVFSKKM